MNGIPLILATVGMIVVGQLVLKSGMRRVGKIDRSRAKNLGQLVGVIATTPQVILGLGIYGLSAGFWIVVLGRTDLSYAYPFLALAYVAVTALATVIFREPFRGRQWLGLALVVAGVAIVAISGA
jgi:drug/metabolite transporter (DMT)-like permease